ncbi:MAG: S1 family serine peptidase [Thermoleophilaceae bacterium]
MFLLVAVAAFAAASVATASADSSKRVYKAQDSKRVHGQIVGGRQIPVTAAPWQVKVNITRVGGGEFRCGGSIINATTVVTAAHCVTDEAVVPNPDVAPSGITVDAGISRFDPTTELPDPQPGDAPETVDVIANRVHPGYPRALVDGAGAFEDFADDVAVLTLATPLDLSGPAKRAIPLTAQNVLSPIGAGGTVTGFGRQIENPPTTNGNLFALDEAVQDASVSPVGSLNALFVIGVAPTGSFCQGDSGSALQVGGAMLGIVSAGQSCAGAQPNFYTNVSAAEIQQFINGNGSPPLAPRGGQNVALFAPAAAPRKGKTLTCFPGAWTNSPSFTYVFSDTSRKRELQRGPSAKYRVTGVSDAGATISCRAQAANAGGVGLTPPTRTPPPVVAAPKPRDRLSVSLKASVVRSARSGAKRHVRTSASALRVRRGQRVAFTLGVRNKGNRRQTTVRRCVRLSSRFTLASRGGGKVSGGRICYTSRSLNPGRLTRRRFVVRVDRDARLGRLVIRASARTTQRATGSARRTLSVLRSAHRAPARRPGVTG